MRIYRRATAAPPPTPRPASTPSPTPTPGRTARAAPTTRACRTTPRSCSGCPPPRRCSRASDYDEYSKTWGFFVQDDWRVNNKLTLNLGLRYEVETALTERNDKSVSGFDYAYVQPIEATVQAQLRGAQRSRPEGARSAAEREGRPDVRRRRRREPAVQDAEEHLPAALRLRLPVEPEDGDPRRRRALRRLPRRAARRRDPERLVADDHRRHDDQRLGRADPAELGRRAPHAPRSSSRSATRTAGRRASGRRSTSSTRTRSVSKQLR